MRISKSPKERREEFLNAAQDLFYEQGVEGTSVQQIVKRVGVAQGLYYYYFHSKKDIVQAVLVRLADRFEEQLRTVVSSAEGTFHEQYQTFLDACFGAYRELVADKRWDGPAFRDEALIAEMSGRVKAIVSSVLAELVEGAAARGELNLPYPAAYVRVVVNGVGDLLLDGTDDLEMARALMVEMIEGKTERRNEEGRKIG